MSTKAPPRIQTLRSDGATPKTSDCFTPRTLEDNDAAFKGPKYGSTVEGPYRSPSVWAGRFLWGATIVLLIVAVALIVAR